jgi:hypothetical protein
MSVYLVTYDLNKPGKDYKGILENIKKFSWARLSESSYAIDSFLSASDLYGQFKPHLDSGDNLYIVKLEAQYFGQGPQEVNQWLAEHLNRVYQY